ncbi:MAG TPA: metallophosphoesterase family protein [Rubrobacteraceae bacterium]|nr:metallophosphoesterase family protein [Rubrobacteraceae bacterium]
MSPLAVILADTHIPRRARTLPEGLVAYLERADLVLHAGDLIGPSVLEELSAYNAPAHAVRGNVDMPGLDLPEALQLDFGGARIAMIHDSGRKEGRRERVGKRFPEARVVVFGHSHIPFLEDENGLLLLNPGSPTDKRRQPEHTFALLRSEEGDVRAEIIAL